MFWSHVMYGTSYTCSPKQVVNSYLPHARALLTSALSPFCLFCLPDNRAEYEEYKAFIAERELQQERTFMLSEMKIVARNKYEWRRGKAEKRVAMIAEMKFVAADNCKLRREKAQKRVTISTAVKEATARARLAREDEAEFERRVSPRPLIGDLVSLLQTPRTRGIMGFFVLPATY